MQYISKKIADMSRAQQQSITFVSAFNKCLGEWLTDLRGYYPRDKDFEVF
jgi:hypothetical protein